MGDKKKGEAINNYSFLLRINQLIFHYFIITSRSKKSVLFLDNNRNTFYGNLRVFFFSVMLNHENIMNTTTFRIPAMKIIV